VRSDDANIMSVNDLSSGSIVGVKRGTTGDDFASTLESVTIVRFDESTQTLDALVDGAVDAAIVDIAVITDYIKESQGQVKLVGGPVTEEEYGIAVNKDRPDVLEMLNTALEQIRADGTYDAIFAKWFGSP
jgi:polar amino acid transport system substrate-binding protein